MMDSDKIIQFIRMRGPVLPVQLAAEIKQNIIIAGAMLSALADSGKIRISNTKVGGSPLYYLEEQRHRLQDFYKHLNEKDRRAYDLLKERKILRDNELTPLLRVSLRNIKDFAVSLEVGTSNGPEIFWRWYMTPMPEAENMIRAYFSPPPVQPAEQPEPAAPQPVQEPPSPSPERAATDSTTHGKTETPKPRHTKPEPEEEQETLVTEPEGDQLFEKTKRFFNQNDIKILETEVIRKNSEIDFVISVPTPIGKIKYYCKAKAKKKCNEGDIAQVYVKGQTRKLPAMLLTNGDLTRKAQDALDTEYENLKFKKVIL